MKAKKIWIIILIIVVALGAVSAFVLFGSFGSKGGVSVMENPINSIVTSHTENGIVDNDAVVKEGINNFNSDYINYILLSLGVGGLHKSVLGYGNPKVEFNMDGETWSTELVDGFLVTKKEGIDGPDFKLYMKKEEVVKALLSPNMENFMKESLINGDTKFDIVAGKIELGSKGYLSVYDKVK